MDRFTNDDARRAWDRGASDWDRFVQTGADYYRLEVHGPGLLDAVGSLEGRTVLDLGCGQGYFSRLLARAGARVVGVDLSERQVANARTHEQQKPLGIDYRLLAADRIAEEFPEGSFDRVTACMSVQDMADVPVTLSACFQVLRPGGRMIFSVPHPMTDGSSKTDFVSRGGYFDNGVKTLRWNMARLVNHWETPYWRYTLGEWSRIIAEAGFLVRQMHEPRPATEQVKRQPKLDDCYRVPYFLVFDLLRP